MNTNVVVEKERLGSLYAVSFLAGFDRIVINSLLVPATRSLHADLGTVTFALTAYLLLFGAMQPVYGIISDLVGRVRVIRAALLGLCVADLVAAFAPNVGVFIAGRALAGASTAALLPVVFAYVGDRVPFGRRQRTIANVLSIAAVGVALATVVAGVLTYLINWRAPVALVALVAPVIAVLVGRRPEAFARQADRPSLPARFTQVFSRGWFRFLFGLALIEGAAMQGFFNFFAPALQTHGKNVVVTGLVTASYGLAVITGGTLVRASGGRVSAATLFGVGGALLCGGYLAAAEAQTVATILAASVLSGLAYAFVQSTVQTWATEVASPTVRGLATSLVACAVFTGAAAGSAAVGGLAADQHFTALFLIAAATTVPVAVVGAAGRARFEPTQPAVDRSRQYPRR
jgi:MFS family permease